MRSNYSTNVLIYKRFIKYQQYFKISHVGAGISQNSLDTGEQPGKERAGSWLARRADIDDWTIRTRSSFLMFAFVRMFTSFRMCTSLPIQLTTNRAPFRLIRGGEDHHLESPLITFLSHEGTNEMQHKLFSSLVNITLHKWLVNG